MNNGYTDSMGNVRISEEVLSTIVSIAAMEVDGVQALASRSATDIKGFITPKKVPSKGVRIDVQGKQVKIELCIVVKLGVKIQEVVGKLQNDVKQAVESMTGMEVTTIDVNVQGMDLTKLEEKPPQTAPQAQ